MEGRHGRPGVDSGAQARWGDVVLVGTTGKFFGGGPEVRIEGLGGEQVLVYDQCGRWGPPRTTETGGST